MFWQGQDLDEYMKAIKYYKVLFYQSFIQQVFLRSYVVPGMVLSHIKTSIKNKERNLLSQNEALN